VQGAVVLKKRAIRHAAGITCARTPLGDATFLRGLGNGVRRDLRRSKPRPNPQKATSPVWCHRTQTGTQRNSQLFVEPDDRDCRHAPIV
jgi:hypothetical protein